MGGGPVAASTIRKPKTKRMFSTAGVFGGSTQWPAVTTRSGATRKPLQNAPMGWSRKGSPAQRFLLVPKFEVATVEVPSPLSVTSAASKSATRQSASWSSAASVTAKMSTRSSTPYMTSCVSRSACASSWVSKLSSSGLSSGPSSSLSATSGSDSSAARSLSSRALSSSRRSSAENSSSGRAMTAIGPDARRGCQLPRVPASG